MANKSSRPKFTVDTFEKAKAILDAKTVGRHATEQLKYMFDAYPELLNCTHEHIGEVMLLQRESVTRAMTSLKKSKYRPRVTA